MIKFVFVYDSWINKGISFPMEKDNFTFCLQLSQELFKSMNNLNKRSIEKYELRFHNMKVDGKMFCCISEKNAKLRIIYEFLEKLSELKNIDVNQSRKFRKLLKPLYEKYNNPQEVDEITKAQGQIDEVRGQMIENLDKIHSNITNLEATSRKIEELEMESIHFETTTKVIKRRTYCRTCLIITLCICCFALICFGIFGGIGGGIYFYFYFPLRRDNVTMI